MIGPAALTGYFCLSHPVLFSIVSMLHSVGQAWEERDCSQAHPGGLLYPADYIYGRLEPTLLGAVIGLGGCRGVFWKTSE